MNKKYLRISELILELKAFKAKHGDAPVFLNASSVDPTLCDYEMLHHIELDVDYFSPSDDSNKKYKALSINSKQ